MILLYVVAVLAMAVGLNACPDPAELDMLREYHQNMTQGDPLNRRWYTVDGEKGGYGLGIWPKSTLPYCFEDDNARTQLARVVIEGWKIWQNKGVPSRADMGEYNQCPSQQPRPPSASGTYLLIRVNNQGRLVTSLGTANYPQGSGPAMTFDPSNNVGMQDPAANMAHEIGHAWGFAHEHQRPDFWSRDYVDGTGASNQINFVCANMRDYQTKLAATSQERMDQACKSYASAKAIGFLGFEYMPDVIQNTARLQGSFDWDSIMLYGSTIGAAPGTNVYTRASDGAVMPFNKVPSTLDIARFEAMYSDKAPRPNPCLINQDCSPGKALFYKVVDKCKPK